MGGVVRTALSSVVVTNVTPFAEDGEVDEEALTGHVRFLVEAGITCLVPGGNTGEFSSLSPEEAARVVELTVEAAGGAAVVVGGVGWSSPLAAEMARAAEAAGADAVMVHHPVHTYLDGAGLRASYERIAAATSLGLVLYKRGPELSDELIAELVGEEWVVGVKYAVNDLSRFADLVAKHAEDAAWICGTAERWAPFFHLAGAKGFTSGLANFAPGISLGLLEALRRGDYRTAMDVRALVAPFEELRSSRPFNANNVPAVKEAMALLGLCRPDVRDPLVRLSESERRFLRELVGHWPLPETAASALSAGRGTG